MQVPRDSKMPLDWIQRACTMNPVKKLLDDKTGQFVGNYSTGPVRLAWTKDLLMPKKTDPTPEFPQGKDRWSCTVLFPPGVDLSILVQASNEMALATWPENMTAAGFNWAGLQSPWSDQMAKASQYKGYTPGAWMFNTATYYPPRLVDPMMNDIVDEQKRVYAGVWAILAVNCYPYGNIKRAGPTKKGVGFGLQSTVLIADDEAFTGGGLDPRAAFKGINIDKTQSPAAMFAATQPIMPPAGGVAPPMDNMAEMRRLGLIT